MLRLLAHGDHPVPELRGLSCAEHLQSIYVSHGRGGAYELRCQNCYSSAVAWKVVGVVLFVVVALFILMFAFARR